MMHILPPSTSKLLLRACKWTNLWVHRGRLTDLPKASDLLRKRLETRVRPRFPRLPPSTHPRRSKGNFAQRHHRSHPHAHTSRPRSSTLTVGEEAPPLPGPARAYIPRFAVLRAGELYHRTYAHRAPVRDRSCSPRPGTSDSHSWRTNNDYSVSGMTCFLPLHITCCVGEPVVGTCGPRRFLTASLIPDTARANARRRPLRRRWEQRRTDAESRETTVESRGRTLKSPRSPLRHDDR